MKDAIGQDIQLEKTYGYTISSNGFATVVIGKVKKIRERTDKKRDLVTLDVIRRQTYLYGNPTDYQKYTSPTVNISPFHLFPVVPGPP